jgi:hypothetical protein
MPTAETPVSAASAAGERRWAWPALALVLLVGLGLRLWGLRQGLPFAYNLDEGTHFVPHAVAMFGKGLNPRYFANPPAFTYLLHYLFALAYGGGAGVERTYAQHPQELYTLARVLAALLGTGALWLLYLTGARLFGRAVGLLAAAIEAVAFLPVFYAHLALNDVPTLAPLTLSLLGSAGILRRGRPRDYLLAGIGLGLACASKYTAGIVVLPLAAAAAARFLDAGEARSRRVLGPLALAGVAALAGFLVANPYALLDYSRFHAELVHQSSLSAEAQGKLGAPKQGGLVYYLWSLTWGLGWAPALFALGGALTIWRTHARLAWMLVPSALAFLAFMGLQGRYFGRWLLPIFPIVCLLAAYFAVWLVRAVVALLVARRARAGTRGAPADGHDAHAQVWSRRVGAALAALLVAVLLAQGCVFSVHAGLVLSRADTRNLTRAWMVGHIPRGARIVAEPVSPDAWARERHGAPACPQYRWCKYASLASRISAAGRFEPGNPHLIGIESYVTTLHPALIGYYERTGFCWVLVGSTQYGRALADPGAVPQAIAYYRALGEQGEVVYRASPYARGAGPVAFNFDWSFDYYPLAYRRPGPAIAIYRLHGGRCAH